MSGGSKRWLWGASIVVLLAVLLLVAASRAEPRYQGKSVSRWIRDYQPIVVGGQWQTNVFPAGMNPARFAPGTRIVATKGRGTILTTNVFMTGGKETYPAKAALKEIGPAAVPYLVEALQAKETGWSKKYRLWYPKIQRRFGKLTPEPPLFAQNLRVRAAEAIGDLHFDGAVTNLVQALGDSDAGVRGQVQRSLRRFAWTQDPIAAELDRFLHGEKRLDIALEAIIALKITRPAAVTVLSNALSSSTNLQLQAARMLTRLGSKGQAAVPALIPLLDSRDKELLDAVFRALEVMGPAAVAGVPALEAKLESSNPEARYLSSRALASMLPEVPAARAALEKALQNENEMVRKVAQRALQDRSQGAGGQE